MTVRNPAWVNNALKQNWDKLTKLVGEKWMPIGVRDDVTGLETSLGREGDRFYEYGSGHYGTVMPTRDPKVVVKITSDPSEAELVAFTVDASRRERHGMPEGLIQYHRIQQLPGAYRKRPIYVIWREAAFVVGPRSYGEMGIGPRSADEGQRYINLFKHAATYVRDYLKKRPGDTATLERYAERANEQDLPVAYATSGLYINAWYGAREGSESLSRFPTELRWGTYWGALETLTELMENSDGFQYVGGALRFYFEHGVLLADVHDGNVGLVHRKGYFRPLLVITDPGHAVFIRPQQYQRPEMVANKR